MLIVSLKAIHQDLLNSHYVTKALHQDHMDAYCVIKDITSGSYGCLLFLKAIHQDLFDSHYVTKALCPLHVYEALCQDHLDAYCAA